jgi:hypothetical protein
MRRDIGHKQFHVAKIIGSENLRAHYLTTAMPGTGVRFYAYFHIFIFI